MLVLGEVLTFLLPTAAGVPPDAAQRMLGMTAGAPVLRSDRPISYVVSPERLEGVDCQVPVGRDRSARGIGTIATRALLTGGHVLQASARTVVERSPHSRRVPWSHYLARPGTLQIIGRFQDGAPADAFLKSTPKPSMLNLTPIAGRAAQQALSGVRLAPRIPVTSHPTTLRWAALLGSDEERLSFCIESGDLRTVLLSSRDCDLGDMMTLCEDMALHDWLVTTLNTILSGAPPAGPKEDRIQAAADHLLHLWMPGVRLGRAAWELWERIDHLAGFERQWTVSVQRIRDHLAVSTLRELSRLGVPR